jgi:hypothetical protein
MYNILSIGRASVFVMPCFKLEESFYQRFYQRQQEVVMLTLERGSLVCPQRNVMQLTVLQLSLCNLHVFIYTSFYFLEAL